MPSRIVYWINRVSNGRVTLIALVVFLGFTAVGLPAQSRQAALYAGEAGSPDTSLIYTGEGLYRMAEAYGAEGRAAYIRARATFDVVWPLVYVAMLSTTIAWTLPRAFPSFGSWRPVVLAPVAAALLDYLENASAVVVMSRFPGRAPIAAALAPAFTLGKWALIGASFGLLVLGAVCALARWVARKCRERGGK